METIDFWKNKYKKLLIKHNTFVIEETLYLYEHYKELYGENDELTQELKRPLLEITKFIK